MSKKDTELQEKGKEKNDQDYDPFSHREIPHPTTFTETMFHLLKGSLGTGILAMPNAFAKAGYLLGSIGTFFIGSVCCYCIHLLMRAQLELCRRKKEPKMSYPNIVVNAFMEGPAVFQRMSSWVGVVVNAFLISFQLGSCSVYVVFVASNLKSVADYYLNTNLDVRIYMIIVLIPLILINYIRNLKLLAPFSFVANLITLVTFGIIWYYIFRDPISFNNRTAVGSPLGYPLFFGTVLFALEAIGIMLPLENEMKEPRRFASPCGVLNIGFVIIVTLYVLMGFFGYIKYGNAILGSITLNLPSQEPLAQSVQLLLAFAIYITHALACYVAIDIIWREYVVPKIKPGKPLLLYELLVRSAIVTLTFLLAVLIPNLGLFISLVGALCLATLGLAIPAMIDILLWYKTVKGFRKFWLFFSNSFLIFVGVVGLLIGTIMPIYDLVDLIKNP